MPLDWISESQATSLGYKKEYNFKRAMQKIEQNQPFVDFAVANITQVKPELRNTVLLRIIGPILRLRIALLGLILTSLNQLPLLAALICLFIEFSFSSAAGGEASEQRGALARRRGRRPLLLDLGLGLGLGLG